MANFDTDVNSFTCAETGLFKKTLFNHFSAYSVIFLTFVQN